jgi:hypothetical protein
MNTKTTEYLAFAALAVGLTIGVFGVLLTWSANLLMVSVCALVLGAVLVKFGDFIIPSVLGLAGRHPVYETLEIINDAIVMKEGDTWTAVGYFLMVVTHTPWEETDKNKTTYLTQLTTLYTHLPERCVISQYVSPVDVQTVRRNLRRQINDLSISLAEAARDGNTPKERELKQKIKELERQDESLDRDRPVDVSFFTKVAGTGTTREGAIEEMRSARTRLESAVRGVLRVNTRTAIGKELMEILKLDMVVPKRELI